MAVFGVELDDSEAACDFMRATDIRLKITNFLTNPFANGCCKKINGSGIWVVVMEPVYPAVYWMGAIMLIGAWIFWGISWLLLPGALIFGVGILWTKWFYYIMLRIGLRKAGYSGKITLIHNSAIIGELVKYIV